MKESRKIVLVGSPKYSEFIKSCASCGLSVILKYHYKQITIKDLLLFLFAPRSYTKDIDEPSLLIT